MALTLLIELSRQDGGLAKFADVWRSLLDPETKEKCVLEEILQQIVVLLKGFLGAPIKVSVSSSAYQSPLLDLGLSNCRPLGDLRGFII